MPPSVFPWAVKITSYPAVNRSCFYNFFFVFLYLKEFMLKDLLCLKPSLSSYAEACGFFFSRSYHHNIGMFRNLNDSVFRRDICWLEPAICHVALRQLTNL